MRYKVKHITEYQYQEMVSIGHNRLCLVPLTYNGQKCLSSNIVIEPIPDELTYQTDFFGNTLLFISIYKEHDQLEITSESTVEIVDRSNGGKASASSTVWHEFKNQIAINSEVYADVMQYTLPSLHVPYSEAIREFVADCFPEKATLWAGCQSLMKKIYSSLDFTPGFTTVNTPVESVLISRKGVCQDFAHLMIACLRNIGLPARYVSGYIETFPPPGKEKLIGSDASHAWVSVYFPEIGWVEFDPTNNLLPSHNHITVAVGRDYFDVAPIKGIIFSSGKQNISVKVDVNRIA
ncbi:MAG TPA: transglutaminase family protein [Cyclobacteriaceae bacterium]|jgi:transglutaminase-like putative cysteine protease|nr:transglutaminase family protein [Cyclobacteriaceae bacterium]